MSMATAAERAPALGPVVAAARKEVAEIDGRIAAAEAEARAAYAAGNIAGGDAASERARDLAASAPRLREHLQTLEAAERAVLVERQAEEHRARRDMLAKTEQMELEEAERQFAMVWPHIRAARAALLAALAAEHRACRADLDRQHAEHALGERETVGSRSRHRRLEGSFDHRILLLLQQDKSLDYGG